MTLAEGSAPERGSAEAWSVAKQPATSAWNWTSWWQGSQRFGAGADKADAERRAQQALAEMRQRPALIVGSAKPRPTGTVALHD